jgi:hypothetical protein
MFSVYTTMFVEALYRLNEIFFNLMKILYNSDSLDVFVQSEYEI